MNERETLESMQQSIEEAPQGKIKKADLLWAERHGIVGAIGLHLGLRGRSLRRYWRRSKGSFERFMDVLR